MKKKICILGSTGSIGCNTLDLIDQYKDKYEVTTLTANKNAKKLAEQAIKFQAKNIVICNESKYKELKELLSGYDINIFSGHKELINISGLQYDITIVGIMGMAAIRSIMQAIGNSKVIGLANKESIVCAGDFIINKAKDSITKIIPLDSEHNAIFQVFEESNRKNIDKILLTASGGPFLNKSVNKLKFITPEQATRHPNWKMGAKVSVDCANMVNKGLEVIEACKLFNLDIDKVDAIIHPESIIHGMVYYSDGSVLSQMAYHDMKTSISTVFEYPKRVKFNYTKLDFAKIGSLNFQKITQEYFPLFYLAKQAYKLGNYALITFNTANEIAVEAFLQKKISFLEINKVIEDSISKIEFVKVSSLEDVLSFSEEIKNKGLYYLLNPSAMMYFAFFS
jgi:1-deoxy-D-xylulose-5-phosphate reductoisomerase